MAEIIVSNRTELLNALGSARGSETIVLRAGNYGALDIDGRNFSSDVKIVSDSPLKARFESVDITNSSNIRIDGVHVSSSTNGAMGSSVVHISGSRGVDIVNSEIQGLKDNVYYGHYGVHVEGSSGIVLDNNFIHDARVGLYLAGGSDTRVSENQFEYLASDSMKVAGTTDLLIENNTGARLYYPSAGEHLDFIQFQGSDSSDIVIRGNVSLPANQGNVQGIFFDDAHYTNVLIEQNIIVTGMIRGVSVSSGTNVVARHNTVLNVEGMGSKATKVLVDGQSYGNIEGSYLQDSGPENGDIILQQADPSKPYYYGSVFANATEGLGITLEDLTPVKGSVAETHGAYARLAELLDGTPSTPAPNENPIANDDVTSTNAGAPVTLDPAANDRDPDRDGIDVTGVGKASNGTAVLNADGTVTYTPSKGFSGRDSFSYTIRDADGAGDTGKVTVDVISMTPEPEPEPNPDPTPGKGYTNLGMHEFSDGSDVILVAHSDALEISSGSISFTFNADTVAGHRGLLSKDAGNWVGGGNHFTTYIMDGTLFVRFQDDDSSKGFSVQGISVNQDYDFRATFGDGQVAVWLDGTKVGSAAFDMDWTSNEQVLKIGAQGWASPSGSNYFSHPFDGTISDIVIAGGIGSTTPSQNRAPIANNDRTSTDHGIAVKLNPLANDSDPDGDSISVSSIGRAGHGTALLNSNGIVTYTPNKGYAGTDSFTYTIRDAKGVSDTATASVEVKAAATNPNPSPTVAYSSPGAHEFAGAKSDVIVVAHSKALELDSGTISFAFNADTVSGHRGLLSKDARDYVGGGNHFASYIKDGSLFVRFQDEDGELYFRADGIKANRDYDFEASFGDGRTTASLDGVNFGSANFDMDWRSNEQFMQIGANGWASASGAPDFDFIFDGTISDVLIF